MTGIMVSVIDHNSELRPRLSKGTRFIPNVDQYGAPLDLCSDCFYQKEVIDKHLTWIRKASNEVKY